MVFRIYDHDEDYGKFMEGYVYAISWSDHTLHHIDPSRSNKSWMFATTKKHFHLLHVIYILKCWQWELQCIHGSHVSLLGVDWANKVVVFLVVLQCGVQSRLVATWGECTSAPMLPQALSSAYGLSASCLLSDWLGRKWWSRTHEHYLPSCDFNSL